MSNEDYWFVQYNFKVGDDLVNVRGRDVEHLRENIAGLNGVVAELAQARANVAGAQALGQVVAPTQPQQAAPPVQQQPWGQQAPQQQQQQAPQQNNGGGGNRFGGEQHPEGKRCHCGDVLEKKTTQSGKPKWQCPKWRWANGNPNGHDMEWINNR